MILRDELTARQHMLQDIGHEETFGKPESYQHVQHRAEQLRERCTEVGSGSGPEPEGRQYRRRVRRPCLTLALRRYGPLYACGHMDSLMTRWRRSLPEVGLGIGNLSFSVQPKQREFLLQPRLTMRSPSCGTARRALLHPLTKVLRPCHAK
jgi:hypothetical protein